MARSRYSQAELFKKALELTGGKGVAKRVVPISTKKTGFDTNEGMIAAILEEGLKGFLGGQADKLEKADLGAARRMRDDYLKPQKDWNVETDGTTPDALRAATMPGALTGNVGATYDPNVKPFPEEDFDDGTDTVRGMAAALGAPNAALGSPLDPGQPYAAGTDEEGDDANWMTPAEHKAFYENEAVNAQAGFDEENPTGMARVDQGNYGVAEPQSLLGQVSGGPAPVPKEQTNTLAMRNLLMGDTLAKRENKEAIARAIATRNEERTHVAGLKTTERGLDREDASTLAAAEVEQQRLDRIADLEKLNRVKNPQQLEQELRLKQAGVPPAVPVAEKEEQKAFGKAIVAREQKVYDRAAGAAATMSFLNLAKSSVNDNSQASGLATILSKTAGFLGVPLPDDFEKRATKSQNFDGMMGNILAEKLAAQKGPQTDRDADRMMQTLASLRNTTEARIFLLDSGAAMASRDLEQGRFYSNFRAKNGTIAGAENAWRNRIAKRPLFGINKHTKLPVFYNQFQTRMKSSNPEMSSDEIEEFWNNKYGGNK